MKNKISLVALVLFFSACGNDQINHQIEDESDFQAIRFTETGCEYTVYSDGLAAVVINGSLEYITRFQLVDDYGNTEYAYCANMKAPCYEGSRYMCASADDYFKNGEDTKIMAALTYMMNEYGWMETDNPHGYRQMIQCILWVIIHGCEVTSVENDEGEIIKDVVNHVFDNIDDFTNDYNMGVTMKGIDIATEDGLFVDYGPYAVSENALLTDVDFQLTFDQGGNDAIFIDETGMKITQVKPENQFYVRVPNAISGDFKFTATASTTKELWYVNDYRFFVDVREGDYQQLFQPVMSSEAWVDFYSCSDNFTITSTENEDTEEVEKITLTGLSWNNGNGNGNGGGINSFTINGITLKNNKNFVTPANFDVMVTKTPDKNDKTAIYTVTERTVTNNNGKYVKVYDIKVALYNDGFWKGYGGTITVDNPGGNNMNQQVDLERIF